MKKCALLLVLVVLTALVAACTQKDNTPSATLTPAPTVSATPGIVPTTPPDLRVEDFIGIWAVSAIYDSSGKALSADEFAARGADFTLELAKKGKYFLYDAAGAPLGQGQYSIVNGQLILSAGSEQTVYAITDTDTLRCTASDGSVTVMTKRCADIGDEGGDDEETGGGDETSPENTGTGESEAPDA